MQPALSRAVESRRVHERDEAILPAGAGRRRGQHAIAPGLTAPAAPGNKSCAGKPALTRWRMLAEVPRVDGIATRMSREPVTGRSRQLRVLMVSIGHPIVGDDLYAPLPLSAPQPLLQACELRLVLPLSGPMHPFIADGSQELRR